MAQERGETAKIGCRLMRLNIISKLHRAVMADAPLLGVFDPTVLKMRPSIRGEIMERTRLGLPDAPIYTYDEMLTRTFGGQPANLPEIKKAKLPRPILERRGKKTAVTNFGAIADALNRSEDHLKAYICAELTTYASINIKRELIITQKCPSATIEALNRKYLDAYVRCPVCKLMDSTLEKRERLLYLTCNQCRASTSIPPIKPGYKRELKRKQ